MTSQEYLNSHKSLEGKANFDHRIVIEYDDAKHYAILFAIEQLRILESGKDIYELFHELQSQLK